MLYCLGGRESVNVSTRSLSLTVLKLKIVKVIWSNVKQKVLQDGYKYPQNRIPSLSILILTYYPKYSSFNFSHSREFQNHVYHFFDACLMGHYVLGRRIYCKLFLFLLDTNSIRLLFVVDKQLSIAKLKNDQNELI